MTSQGWRGAGILGLCRGREAPEPSAPRDLHLPRGAENGRTEALRPLLEMERAWGSRRWEGCGCPFLVSLLLLRAPLSLPIDLSCILSCGLPSPVSCREGDASSLLFFSSIIFRFLLYISRPLFCLSLHFFFFFPLFFSLSAD